MSHFTGVTAQSEHSGDRGDVIERADHPPREAQFHQVFKEQKVGLVLEDCI
jgi:hypothetical protein